MTRIERFQTYATHPMLKKIYNKLSGQDIALANSLLVENAKLDRNDFEQLINRYFLHNNGRSKNNLIIQELLSCANSGGGTKMNE